ncbi:hypothetical protein C8R43DRAFT_1154884 [Mycena crocata]|nr:hypothetical protein C8R43DRAFT_1154884 [Mycena crocata]
MSDSGLVTQFTEDLASTEATICDRESCKAYIAVGEPRHYIAGYNSQKGKDFERLPQSQAQDVRRDVNAARKKGASRSTRRVTPVSNRVDMAGDRSQGLMLPPALPPQPRIVVPSTWNHSGFTYPPPPTSSSALVQAYGYSPVHSQYRASRDFWASKAYQSDLGETFTVWFKVFYESNGKPKGTQVKNLSEGKPNVQARITPTELRTLGIKTMEEKVQVALKDYPMDWSRLILREIKDWVDLAHEPHVPYFYRRCLTGKPKGKDATKTFKAPGKPFELAFIIDPDHWEEISQYMAEKELEREAGTLLKSTQCNEKRISARHIHSASTGSSVSETSSRSVSPSEYNLNSASFNSIQNDATQSESSKSRSSKRSRSDSRAVPTTPPRSKRRAIPTYESPNRDQLRTALLEGGSSLTQLQVAGRARTTSERIEFFQIQNQPLNELLSSENCQGFVCVPANAYQGSLGIENANYLGIGTFKTAQPGYLTLVHFPTDGLGIQPNEGVAVKRMYVRTAKPTERNPEGWMITRFMPADEFRKTIMEANVLAWAVSLMTFTYSFIHHFIANSSDPLPFDIPEVRFVHAGVALVHEHITTPTAGSKSTILRSYLIEEKINEAQDGFYKFINNGSAVPLQHSDASEYLSVLGRFLAFTQHVQYYKSGGMVYLSDLQGSTKLLTDPQIMTSPSIGDGIDIFGDGNVPSAFEAFPMQHICNEFCLWFKLPSTQ